MAAICWAVACSSGCTVCLNVHRTLCAEPKRFNWKVDHVTSQKMYYEWAEAAWIEVGRSSAPSTSENYQWGFRDGFASLVFAGGNGEPPAAPPRPFWKAGWRTGRGKQAADEWFAGYRHGATVARAGGYRDQAVMRSSVATAGFLFAGDASSLPYDGMEIHGESIDYPAGMRPEFLPPQPPETIRSNEAPSSGATRPTQLDPLPPPPMDELLPLDVSPKWERPSATRVTPTSAEMDVSADSSRADENHAAVDDSMSRLPPVVNAIKFRETDAPAALEKDPSRLKNPFRH